MSLVAGRRVELACRKAVVRCLLKTGTTHVGIGEVGSRQRGGAKGRLREVRLAEVSVRQRGKDKVRVGEVLFGEVGTDKIVPG